MANAIAETVTSTRNAAEQAPAKPSAQVVRWLVTGLGALVVLSLVGGALVGLMAGRSFTSKDAVAQCAKAIRVYDLLVVSPLAIALGAALVVGVPMARILRASKSRPATSRFRKVMRVLTGVKLGFVTAALFWSVSGLVVPGTSIAIAHWSNGYSADTLRKDFYGFKLPSVEYWSIFGSIGLALLLIAVAMVAGQRFVPAEGRPTGRQALVVAAALTVAFAGFSTWHATQTYDDLRGTKVTAEQGQD
ncbi:hypothetical protein ACWD5Q_24315 [Streptomyces sp. NPDC002513]